MNRRTKSTILALTASGLLIGGSLVGAQVTGGAGTGGVQSDGVQSDSLQDNTLETPFLGRGHHGFGGFGLRGLPFGRLALGTTVEVSFYDGLPTEGNVTDTLDFTYGEDSEVAFAEAFANAQQNAEYVMVEVGEQTRTVNLSEVTIPADGRGLLPRELAGRGLEEGGTVTATFYDGDPEAGGSVVETLAFTYFEDSAAGFAESFAAAAEEAAFVEVTTEPQTYTVDLSEVSERAFDGDGRGFERRGRR